jgi:hypothetical protein
MSRKTEEAIRCKVDSDALKKWCEEHPIGLGAVSHDRPEITPITAWIVKEVLEAVIEVVGVEAVTEAVICTAITEAGYSTWRSIMGPELAQEEKRKDRVVL